LIIILAHILLAYINNKHSRYDAVKQWNLHPVLSKNWTKPKTAFFSTTPKQNLPITENVKRQNSKTVYDKESSITCRVSEWVRRV